MRLIHADVTELIAVKDDDLVRLLEHPHCNYPKNIGHGFGPTLVGRGRRAHAAYLHFAMLLDEFRRLGLQDRIGIIADKLPGIAYAPLWPAAQTQTIGH